MRHLANDNRGPQRPVMSDLSHQSLLRGTLLGESGKLGNAGACGQSAKTHSMACRRLIRDGTSHPAAGVPMLRWRKYDRRGRAVRGVDVFVLLGSSHPREKGCSRADAPASEHVLGSTGRLRPLCPKR